MLHIVEENVIISLIYRRVKNEYEVGAAHELLESKAAIGKIVIQGFNGFN